MFCFSLGPDMKCSESFINSFEKKLNLLKLFCLGKTFMDLDVEESTFKDFFPLVIMIFFHSFIFRGAPDQPVLGATDPRDPQTSSPSSGSPARIRSSAPALATPLPGLRCCSLSLGTQKQISRALTLLELAIAPLRPRDAPTWTPST